MITLAETGLARAPSADELGLLRASFRDLHHARLPGLLSPSLLATLRAQLRSATFVPKTHAGIGHELACWDSPASDTLLFLFNDPRLFDLVTAITGVGPIGCFVGRLYRMEPGAAHHESWHSDVGHHRLIACSLNLSDHVYTGGTLLLREADRPDTEQRLPNVTPGDAVLFRVDPGLEHYIEDVQEGGSKTAWAGWFRSEPSFMDVVSKKAVF